jgi:hypothetical protein
VLPCSIHDQQLQFYLVVTVHIVILCRIASQKSFTRRYTSTTTNTSCSIKRIISILFTFNCVRICCISWCVYRYKSSMLKILSKALDLQLKSLLLEMLQEWFDCDCVTIFKHTHVQLTSCYFSIWSVSLPLINKNTFRKSFATIMVKCYWLSLYSSLD